jgi:hypothetical protein
LVNLIKETTIMAIYKCEALASCVIAPEAMGSYCSTIVEASSEEEAVQKATQLFPLKELVHYEEDWTGLPNGQWVAHEVTLGELSCHDD